MANGSTTRQRGVRGGAHLAAAGRSHVKDPEAPDGCTQSRPQDTTPPWSRRQETSQPRRCHPGAGGGHGSLPTCPQTRHMCSPGVTCLVPKDEAHGAAVLYDQHKSKSPDATMEETQTPGPDNFTLNLEMTKQRKNNLSDFTVRVGCGEK